MAKKRTGIRFLAFFISIAIMLTSSPVFGEEPAAAPATTPATTPAAEQPAAAPDVKQIRINQAVDKLMALGIVQGKEDGNYHPELPITREEFAKLVVTMIGIRQDIITKGGSEFSDVAADSWSAPYINAASQSGLIKGYDDGRFMPQNNVTLAEVVTVIVRVLGYKDEYIAGEWPGNYISKAGELRLLEGIDIKQDNNVNRGIVAMIVESALEANPIKDGIKSDKTLLEDRIGIYTVEDIQVLERIPAEKGDLLKVKFNKAVEFGGRSFLEDEEYTFTITSDKKVSNGEDVTVYVNDKDRIVYVKDEKKIEQTQPAEGQSGGFDYIENAYSQKPLNMIKLSSDDDYISISEDAYVYVDGEKIDPDDFSDVLEEGVFGKFIVNGGELEYASLVSWDLTDIYVETVDVQKQTINCIATREHTDIKVALSKYSEGYEINLVENGQAKTITLAEVVKGDMLNISEEQDNGGKRKIFVWRKSASGRLERVSGGMNGQKITFKIQGLPDIFELPDEFSYSYNSGKRIRTGSNRDYNTMKSLEDFYNETVNIYRNWKGDIMYLEGQFSSNSDLYGVLIQYGDSVRGEIKIYTHTNTKKVYAFEDSDEYGYIKGIVEPGVILRYSVSKAGTLKRISDNLAENVIGTDNIKTIKSGNDFDDDSVNIGGRLFTVDSDTVFFDYTDHNPENVKKLTWDKFKNREVVEDVKVIVDTDDDYLKMMAVWENMDGIKEETIAGYAADNFSIGTDRYVEIYGLGNQDVQRYKLESAYKNRILGGRLVLYQITTGSDIKIIDEDDDFEFIAGEIQDVKGNEIEIENRSYRLDSKMEVFEGRERVDRDNLEEDQLVAGYVKDARIVLLEILDGNKNYTVDEGVLIDVNPDNYDECFTIEVGGVEKTFSNGGDVDYVFRNGYMLKGEYSNSTDMAQIFEGTLGGQKPNIKFVYDRYTDEIRNIWVDKNR